MTNHTNWTAGEGSWVRGQPAWPDWLRHHYFLLLLLLHHTKHRNRFLPISLCVPEELQLHSSSSRRWEPGRVTFSFFLGIRGMGNLCTRSNMSDHLVILKWRKVLRGQVTCPGMVAELDLKQVSHLPDQCPFHELCCFPSSSWQSKLKADVFSLAKRIPTPLHLMPQYESAFSQSPPLKWLLTLLRVGNGRTVSISLPQPLQSRVSRNYISCFTLWLFPGLLCQQCPLTSSNLV